MKTDVLPVRFLVEFAEHIPADRISDMSGSLAVSGDVEDWRGEAVLLLQSAERADSKASRRSLRFGGRMGLFATKTSNHRVQETPGSTLGEFVAARLGAPDPGR